MKQALIAARQSAIYALATQAEIALLDPSPQGNTGPQIVCGFRALLDGYTAAVMAAHSSSRDNYAIRDLPASEKESYDRALHAIKILEQVYPLAVSV